MSLLTSTAFLVEFLSAGRWRPLTASTEAPDIRPLAAGSPQRPVRADLYVAPGFRRPSGLVLVHGITPRGKDDPQMRAAAALLARCGWAVAVPTVDGLTALRLRPDDALAVTAAARALDVAGYRPVALLGISLGAAPVLSAAADPGLAPSLSAVLTLGGYASARELLRYTLTGAYALGDLGGRRAVDEEGIARFAAANAELLAGGGGVLVGNRDAGRVDALIEGLPTETRKLLDALSPERALPRVTAELFFIHGRDVRTVPFTESLRLDATARRSGRRVRTTIVGAVTHVDPGERLTAGELVGAWSAFYAFRVVSTREPR